MARILLAEDDEIILITLYDRLRREQWQVDQAEDGGQALALIEKGRYHVVISDIRMPGLDGISLMERVKEMSPHTEVILMTAYGNVDDAVDCMRKGAADYILKPFDMDDLTIRIRRLLDKQILEARCASLSEELVSSRIIGDSTAITRVEETISKVAVTGASVLISGESGTGKELVAAAIHNQSLRADGPYIKINCAAIPETLIESELFGHEKGSFTGAHARKIGKFELADRGTILLDEIGEMPLPLQAKLLRVLQEKEIERVGGKQPVAVDVRVMCATARDLAEEVREGRFRKDLLYRLKVIPIHVPPLRERKEDIPLLCDHFLEEFNAGRHSPVLFTQEAMDYLTAYDYPGNIRELRNIIERATVLRHGAMITPADLPCDMTSTVPTTAFAGDRLADAVAGAEKLCILRALRKCNNHKSETAAVLGISRKTLWEKIKHYRLEPDSSPG